MLANRRYIFEQTRGMENIEFYDFQAESLVISDLMRYCDLIHFDTSVNENIIDAIVGNGMPSPNLVWRI